MKFEDIKIPGDIITIEGEKHASDIFMIALSTCQWCKKGKKWLQENNYKFRYLDIDKVPFDDKREFKRDISNYFNTMVRYPFLIVDGDKFYAGFNIDNWKDMFIE